jgi:hypothetical protein
MKVSMDMDVAPNPNPPDIRISMDIHRFTYYVHHVITIIILEHFGNISAIIIWTMKGSESGGHGHDCFDCLVSLVGSK